MGHMLGPWQDLPVVLAKEGKGAEDVAKPFLRNAERLVGVAVLLIVGATVHTTVSLGLQQPGDECDGLFVQLKSGKNLKDQDWFSQSDTYAKIKPDGLGEFKTGTVKNSNNPDFSQVENSKCWTGKADIKNIKVKIFDHDSLSKHAAMGECDLSNPKTGDVSCSVKHKGKSGGTLSFYVRNKAADDAAAEEAAAQEKAELERLAKIKADKSQAKIAGVKDSMRDMVSKKKEEIRRHNEKVAVKGKFEDLIDGMETKAAEERIAKEKAANIAKGKGALKSAVAGLGAINQMKADVQTTKKEEAAAAAKKAAVEAAEKEEAEKKKREAMEMKKAAEQAEQAALEAETAAKKAANSAGSSEQGSAEAYDKPFAWACDHKIRKDWVDLTDAERDLYLEAVNSLKTTARAGSTQPAGPGNNLYDAFVQIHGESENKKYAHQTAGFLAWHRKFLLEYEESIRTHLSENEENKFSCVTLPYWDWSSETYQCSQKKGGCTTYHEASKLLSDFGGPGSADHTKNTHGSSGSGDVGCVKTGPFKDWVDHEGKCLSRGVNWNIKAQRPFSGRMRLAEINKQTKYGTQHDRGFRVILEGIPHGSTHNYLGGHMRSFISPADPIFFSHHCFIDKLWAVWQDCHDMDTESITQKVKEATSDEEVDNIKAYYQETSYYGDDAINDPMIMNYPPKSVGGASQCSKSSKECAACVHKQDNWCRHNDWDKSCKNFCSDRACKPACKDGGRELVNMNVKGDTILQGWDTSEVTPASMHSVHDLGERSYSYAPDEFERHLEKENKALLGDCKLDSHKKVQKAASFLEEASRFHHGEGTPRSDAAKMYATMTKRAFDEAEASFVETKEGQTLYQAQLSKVGDEECKAMAGGKEYSKVFNCATDQPRFWKVWFGRKGYNAIMSNKKLRKLVFQDYCCKAEVPEGKCIG